MANSPSAVEPFLGTEQFLDALAGILPFRPSRRTLQRWVQHQGLPCHVIPGSRRQMFKISQFLDWIDRCGLVIPPDQAGIDALHRKRLGQSSHRS